jgi:outer membrane protein assembly factor BamB
VRPKAGISITNGTHLYTNTDAGDIVCLNPETGIEIWRQKVPFNLTKRKQFSQPLIIKDTLVCGAYDGNVYGFDTVTGERRWVCFDADWITGSPCKGADGSFLIPLDFGFFKKTSSLACLNHKDGSILWRTPTLDGRLQSPAFSLKRSQVIVGTESGHLYTINAKNGKILWDNQSKSLPIRIVNAPGISETTNTAIVTGLARNNTETAGVYAYDLTDGSVRWKNEELMYGSYGTPIFYDTYVLITGLDKSLRALDIKTGKTVWKTNFQSRVFSTPTYGQIRDKAYIYLGTNDSVLYEIEPSTGAIIGATMFTERITNQVLLDTTSSRLYVPTYANEIYALTPKP